MVAGEGPQPCLGMIVGEAPGRKEVELGQPFVGKAGGLLNAALRACGVRRDEVYITNVVKDLLLDSEGRIRRPYREEVEAWLPILQGEIENTAPDAILALGRTAIEALVDLDGEKVGFGSKIGPVFTAWHPAYVLRHGRIGAFDRDITDRSTFDDWLEQIRAWAEAWPRGIE